MRKCFFLPLWLAIIIPVWPQGESAGGDDPSSYIGLTLTELIRRFGAPLSVHAVRGLEQWQDDVVFVYDQGDFYVYKDRVWQADLKAALGIKTGDLRGHVFMVLDSMPGPSQAETRGDSVFYPLDGGSWPLMLRCDFDRAGRVEAIFIYRPDF